MVPNVCQYVWIIVIPLYTSYFLPWFVAGVELQGWANMFFLYVKSLGTRVRYAATPHVYVFMARIILHTYTCTCVYNYINIFAFNFVNAQAAQIISAQWVSALSNTDASNAPWLQHNDLWNRSVVLLFDLFWEVRDTTSMCFFVVDFPLQTIVIRLQVWTPPSLLPFGSSRTSLNRG